MFAIVAKDEEKPDGICQEERKKLIDSRETVRRIKKTNVFSTI
jgi:hypothetical protein